MPEHPRRVGLTCLVLALFAMARPVFSAENKQAEGFQSIHTKAAPWKLAEEGRPAAEIVALSDSELVTSAIDWIRGEVEHSSGASLTTARTLAPAGKLGRIVAVVGQIPKELAADAAIATPENVGPQGFVLQRVSGPKHGEMLVCWSPTPLGCRYGLIELLRSLKVKGKTVSTDIAKVVDRPAFPTRICYVNFAEHLQNAYNPNVLFDTPVNRWSRGDWERFIDMVSAFRYNVFEFWLVPTLFSPEALRGGKIQRDFAETMNHVIAYAKRRGVAVHPIQAVNTVGADWHYHCPNLPKERAEIVALWDHWSRALQGNELIGFFPGDPGGCTKNGCTAETYVDLCLELSKVVRRNNPGVKIEVGTWGDPMAGWGASLWTGRPDRAERAMKYFLAKLPQFPPETFTSINLGFSPDCLPTTHGGDGRPYAKEAARQCPVLTWDYSVTEGEGTVSPRCRVRRMFAQRREEQALGCYSGGICYTMAPKLQCLSIFCCGEAWWNPSRKPDAVLADYGRLVFGEDLAQIGPLLEELEVVPDWGYYPPFPYSPQRVQAAMARLLPLLEKANPQAHSRLPLATTMSEYRADLIFFADLFQKLARTAITLDELTAAAKASERIPGNRAGLVSLTEAETLLAEPADFPQKGQLRELAGRLRSIDVRGLTKSYWDRVYGIYGVIPHPVDPRAQGATTALFNRFNCQLALAHEPSTLEKALRATGKPFALVEVGRPEQQSGWRFTGWTLRGEDGGEAWQASFEQPGIVAHDDFADKGYRWLVVRLTEGPKGGRKTITVNGKVIGQFVRTGPPVSEKKEWWVTRSFPIPEGVLQSGKLEIRFTDPGIAIAGVALSTERVADTR